MIKILVVDDNYDKISSIASNLKHEECGIETCHSVKDALAKLKSFNVDILVIDLQIPLSLGDSPVNIGGLELLKFVHLEEGIVPPKFIVGATSHIEPLDHCESEFKKFGWPVVNYSADDQILFDILKNQIKYIQRGELTVDIAIITALRAVELEEILRLPLNWTKVPSLGEDVIHLGHYKDKNDELKKVLATSCSRMGMVAAASTTTRICERYEPGIIFMTGIAAGIEGKVEIGDILIADPCWDWGNGKRTIQNGKMVFQSAPHQLSLPDGLRQSLKDIAVERRFLDDIHASWTYPGKPPTALNLHVGPIATGAVVLEDPDTVSEIRRQHRETIGIEMEGYGVMQACSSSRKETTACIIKSVCDFADPEKNDNWQRYAAFSSSQFAYKLLTKVL